MGDSNECAIAAVLWAPIRENEGGAQERKIVQGQRYRLERNMCELIYRTAQGLASLLRRIGWRRALRSGHGHRSELRRDGKLFSGTQIPVCGSGRGLKGTRILGAVCSMRYKCGYSETSWAN